MQVVLSLRAYRAGALTSAAHAAGNFHTELHGRQEGIEVFQMDVESAALQYGADIVSSCVLGVTGAETVHVNRGLELPQAVVDAEKEPRPETTAHDLAVGAAHLIPPALEQHAEVRFQRRAERPRLVRGFNVETVTGTVTEIRHSGCRFGGLLLKLDLLLFQLQQLLL